MNAVCLFLAGILAGLIIAYLVVQFSAPFLKRLKKIDNFERLLLTSIAVLIATAVYLALEIDRYRTAMDSTNRQLSPPGFTNQFDPDK